MYEYFLSASQKLVKNKKKTLVPRVSKNPQLSSFFFMYFTRKLFYRLIVRQQALNPWY